MVAGSPSSLDRLGALADVTQLQKVIVYKKDAWPARCIGASVGAHYNFVSHLRSLRYTRLGRRSWLSLT